LKIETSLLCVLSGRFVPFEAVGDSVDVDVDADARVSGVSGVALGRMRGDSGED